MDLYVEAVRNMMLDSETRNRLAESAIKKVQRFSAEQVVKQWLSIFDMKRIIHKSLALYL